MTITMNYVFDANQHQPDAGFELVPAGTYDFQIESTEIANIGGDPSKGQQFKIGVAITSGEHQGKKLFKNYGIWNQNPQTVSIAHGQLSALGHVTGIYKIDMNQGGANLKGAKFRGRVTNDGTYNEIKEVFDTNGNKPGKAGSGAGASAPVATATPAPANWPAPAATPVAVATPAAAPAAPVAPPAPAPVVAAFPPAGWTLHPSAPGYYYQGQEVVSEADLRARTAPAAPTVPAAPAAPATPGWGQQPAAGAPPAAAPWGQPAA